MFHPCTYIRTVYSYYILIFLSSCVIILQYGRTPLYCAAECGHLQIIELLLSKGAEIDSKDKVSSKRLAQQQSTGSCEILCNLFFTF